MADDVPAGLLTRGRALWHELVEGRDLAGGGRSLAIEACRIADRLDRLDAILNSDTKQWGYFRRSLDRLASESGDGEQKFVLVITSALAEARQQAAVLRQIVAGLPMKGGEDDNSGVDDFINGLSA